MRECPDCEIPLQRGKCRKCGWQASGATAGPNAKPKVRFIKDCSWRGGPGPCPNLATMYPLTFDPNAEGLCGEHWSKSHEPMTAGDDAAAKTAMSTIRRILSMNPALKERVVAAEALISAAENAGW